MLRTCDVMSTSEVWVVAEAKLYFIWNTGLWEFYYGTFSGLYLDELQLGTFLHADKTQDLLVSVYVFGI